MKKLNPRQLEEGMLIHLDETFYVVKNVNRIGTTSYCSQLFNESGDVIKEFFLIDDVVEVLDESFLKTNRLDKEEKSARDSIVKKIETETGLKNHSDKFKKKLAQNVIMVAKDLYTKQEEEQV
jgi:hypothetical protein